jgi:tRNA 2-thiouridine synthesizing protein A
MKGLSAGAVVCVLATDPGIATDMPMWCRATRNEHLGTYREGTSFRSWVRKRGAP